MLKETSEGVVLSVKVSPKAGKSAIVGEEGGELKLRIAAVPEKGKANAEIIRLISHHLGISKSLVEILAGETSKHKKLLIKGATVEEIRVKLLQ